MRAEKSQMVETIGQWLTNTDFIYFISYKGLKVKDFSDLRRELSKHHSECHVLKNRLIRKAAELKAMKALGGLIMREDTALITGRGDPGSVAKVIAGFAKTHEAVAAKGGYLEGALLAGADIRAIATLPSREVLLAQLLGVIQAPARNLVSALNAKVATIINVLQAYCDKIK